MMRSSSKPLTETHPDLASQALGWDPSRFSARSPKTVDWKCAQGHVTKSRIADRSKVGTCPVCSGRKVLAGFNDLLTSHPQVANEAFDWDPTSIGAGSGRKVKWKCELGHIYEAQVANRTKLESGCPICSGRKVLPGFNDLLTKFPEIAKEADGWDPSQVTWGSGVRKKWRCVSGHSWESTVNSRTSNSTGCAVCSGRKVLAGENDLATTHPEIALQAIDLDPSTVSAGSNLQVNWKCSIGHIWTGTVKSRTHGGGCPVCSNKLVIAGENDLATTHPELASQADGWDPKTLTSGSDQEGNWKCHLGHVWRTTPKSRSRGSGCPVCSGQQVLKGFNDLATTHPELASQADGWDPSLISRGSGSKLKWKCENGHSYEAVVSSRTGQGSGCPICSGHQVLAGFNDLLTTHPELAHEADGWDPSTVGFGSKRVVAWRCQQGHQWKVRVATRASQGRGCPSCAFSGFDPNIDGWLYFLFNDHLNAFQIGITNYPENRLSTHAKGGWETLDLRGPMEGSLARDLETASLRALKRHGAVFLNKTDQKKFDGWSESWLASSFQVTSINKLLELVYQDESLSTPNKVINAGN